MTKRLREIENAIARPVYFVLGNHDFYGGSIWGVRHSVTKLCRKSEHLHWLGGAKGARLTEKTWLVGHDGWGDARLGNYNTSNEVMTDFGMIRELQGKLRQERLKKLNFLGDRAAHHLKGVLGEALPKCEHAVVLTHVPPFVEAAWHRGRTCNDDLLPFFSCEPVGDVLREAMSVRPGPEDDGPVRTHARQRILRAPS